MSDLVSFREPNKKGGDSKEGENLLPASCSGQFVKSVGNIGCPTQENSHPGEQKISPIKLLVPRLESWISIKNISVHTYCSLHQERLQFFLLYTDRLI